MKKISFLIHGKAAKHSALEKQLRTVFVGDYELSFQVTRFAGHFIELGTQAVQNGADYIICVGGDGSLNEVANGVMRVKDKSLPGAERVNEVRIGVLPRGTGNDFVKSAGGAPDMQGLKKLVDDDKFMNIDLGLAEYTSPLDERVKRYFINITDIGIGGVIANKLAGSSKRFGPTITYQYAVISTLFSYKNQQVKVTADTFSYTGKVMSLIVANGKYFGGGMGIAPHAAIDDAQFAIVVIGEISMMEYLKNLGDIKKCKTINHPQVTYHTAKEIQIETPGCQQPIDMDGEFAGTSPLKISMAAGAIKFLG
ncbi:MAG TPA: YegS/Rv2252/BmrU family lipid kinase [Chitinophagales bacterium]|nr:YegS/Rv2252/BmrU family lipid kinase [Chitinophagales bacterium]